MTATRPSSLRAGVSKPRGAFSADEGVQGSENGVKDTGDGDDALLRRPDRAAGWGVKSSSTGQESAPAVMSAPSTAQGAGGEPKVDRFIERASLTVAPVGL